ncbi:MAG: cellulose biosynthesis protein BcsS [Hyphomicrobiales bacterium]
MQLPTAPVCLGILFATVAVARAQEAYFATGAGGGLRDREVWQATTYTPFGTLDDPGPVARAVGTYVDFQYDTALPDDPDARITVTGWKALAEVGWQWRVLGGKVAAFAGAAAQEYALAPADPGSDLAGFQLSASLSATADIPLPLHDVHLAGDLTWTPQMGELWVAVRPGYDLGEGWRIGPEAALSQGPDYQFIRVGVFTSGYRFATFGRTFFLGGEAGVSDEPGSFQPFPYAAVWLGTKF